MKHLHIGEHFTLPADAVTQTFAIFGKRGSGKSNAATVMAEEMFRAGLQFVVLDPVDAWWGLKSSADGKEPGLAVYVFGGPHGDLPLEPTAGALMADVVMEHQSSCVLSFKGWSGADRTRFAADFAAQLLSKNTEPLHVFLEEADAFIPQRPFKGEERMLGNFDRMVRWGRASGIGSTLITQRSAKVNKDVTTQAETLIAFRLTGPQDRDAIDAWIKYHAGEEKRHEVLATLPALPNGTAWVWSPEWLDVLKQVAFRFRKTYDSASTPKVGEKRPTPKALADVDLDQLRGRLAATIERAKADDPKELRRQIAELKKQLAAKAAALVAPERVEVPVLKAEQLEALKQYMAGLLGFQESIASQLGMARDHIESSVSSLERSVRAAIAMPHRPTGHRYHRSAGETKPARAVRHTPCAEMNGDLSETKLAAGERKILTALAQYSEGRTKTQVAVLTGYAVTGGGFNNYLSALRSRGWIAGSGENLRITDAGLTMLGGFNPLPTGQELANHWLRQLPRAERLILGALVERFPETVSKEELGGITGYEPSGGGFNNALGRLRTLELVEGRGELRASEDLFG